MIALTKPPTRSSSASSLLGGGTSMRITSRDCVAALVLAYLRDAIAPASAVELSMRAARGWPSWLVGTVIDELEAEKRIERDRSDWSLPRYRLRCDTCGGTGYAPCGCEEECEHGACSCPVVLCDCPAGGAS